MHIRAWAVLLTALAVATPAIVAAQNGVPCTTIENDAERLACYDRALRPAPVPPAARAAAPAAAAQQPATPTAPATATAERRAERNVRDTTAPVAPVARGAGQAEAPEDEIVPIVVVGLRALPGRETTFVTDAGERWVQTDSQRVRMPDVPFDAEIKRGAMASYFLVPKDRGRAVRVRPVR